MKKSTSWLIAHTASNGLNVAQATIEGRNEAAARATFRTLFPERVIIASSMREGRAPTRRERKGR